MDDGGRGLRDFLRAVAFHKWAVIVILLVATAATAGIPLALGRDYTAASTVAVSGLTLDLPLVNDPASADLEGRRMQSELSLAESASVAGLIRSKYHLRSSDLDVSNATDSNLLTFSATASRRSDAVKIADAFALQYVAVRKARISNEVAAENSALQGKLAQLATQPTGPSGHVAETSQDSQATAIGNSLASLAALQSANDSGSLASISTSGMQEVTSSPNVSTDGAIGFVAGVLLSIIFVLVAEARQPTRGRHAPVDRGIGAGPELFSSDTGPVLQERTAV